MTGKFPASLAKLSLLSAATLGVCLGQLPPSDSVNYAAKAVTVTGQVSVLRDTTAWAISAGDSVKVREVIWTGPDGHAMFQVSDGSSFEVYPNSRVVFRKNPPNWSDLLDVLVGRIRVHIEHLGIIPNPNRVLTPTAVISVRGTTFDVAVEDDDETTTIQVEEGVVDVEHALLPNGTAKRLTAGESLRVYRSEPIARRIDKGNIAQHVLRGLMDLVVTVGTRTPKTVGGVGGGDVGDTDKTKTPPPPPPPPPPLPPLH